MIVWFFWLNSGLDIPRPESSFCRTFPDLVLLLFSLWPRKIQASLSQPLEHLEGKRGIANAESRIEWVRAYIKALAHHHFGLQ